MGGNYNDEMLEEFILQMIADKGDGLNEDQTSVEKARLTELLTEQIESATVDALPEETAKELERLIDEKGDNLTEDEVSTVVNNFQPAINEAIKRTMEEFRERYLRGEE